MDLGLDKINLSNNNFGKVGLIKLNQWTLDPFKKTLTDNNGKCITLEEKPTLLLVYLAQMRGEIVTREQLIEHVWNNRYIDSRTINATISRLRKKLGGEKNEFIETLTKVGYSLTCNVELIGKTSLDPVTPSSQDNISSPSKLTFYKRYIIFTIALILLGLWLLNKDSNLVDKVLTPVDVTIEPLTYMEGWELAPALSKDKSLLAFKHFTEEDPKGYVVVQNMANKKTIVIEPSALTNSPYWAPDSNTLFYQSHSLGQCWIKKIKISENFTLGKSEKITSCGNVSTYSNIAVSRDNNWLYYTTVEALLSPAIIKRFNLQNKITETLTAPPVKYEGDFRISLSSDDSKLAFIREYDDMSKEVMVLNLSSGEITSLAKFDFFVDSLAWTKSDKEIAFITLGHNLHLINVKTKDITKIYQQTKKITAPFFLSDNELLLSFGDSFTANIKQIDLNQAEPKTHSLISSGFKDHSGAYFKTAKNEKIAFVSNRSGSYQIWLKENNALVQLTHFKNKEYLYDMSFSANGENLLIQVDEKWHVLNIKTGKLIKLKPPGKLIRSAIWQCYSNDTILTIADNNGIWNLYSLNVTTQKSEKLSTGLTAIHSDCFNDKYYAAIIENKGIFELSIDWTINKSLHYFPEIPFASVYTWAVGKKAIYRRGEDNNIWQYDILTDRLKKVGRGNDHNKEISIQHNTILINDLGVADTFIGKLTLPE